MASLSPITVPEGFTLHKENSAHILLPTNNEAFLNPVQEFNRDMSIACIRVWSEDFAEAKEKKRKERQERAVKKTSKKMKAANGASKAADAVHDDVKEDDSENAAGPSDSQMAVDGVDAAAESNPLEPAHSVPGSSTAVDPIAPKEYGPYRFTVLEALSATGLRSIRYAHEIPLVRHVLANDLSPAAVAALRRNVELNKLGPTEHGEGKIRISEMDANALMYSHRDDRKRVDCVDLDPYGTAAPFIDAAVQCVQDGGLLCVTCTDMSVLATNNYPEKCFANYGGVPVRAEYCHEAALRLVLHTVSTSAARYGRYIQPLLSLSIDFYVRLFIRVQSGPNKVKEAASKTSTHYVCSCCQSFYEQPLGKITEKVSGKTGDTNFLYRQRTGPPVGGKCPECDSALHVAGPMWNGPIHDPEFAARVLTHVEAHMDKYGTAARMQGMLTVAKEELQVPFYFTPSRVAGFFHCIAPSLDEICNALLHAGHEVSRSHAFPGSLKTSASRQDVHDVFRCWVKTHPVKPESISSTSPSHHLHSKEPRFTADFSRHPQAVTQASKVKLVRYQHNPTPNWGPGTRAGTKRKRDDEGGGGG